MSKVCTVDHLKGGIPSELKGLPESQSGPWRHKCPACAYELGLKHGIRTSLRGRIKDGRRARPQVKLLMEKAREDFTHTH